MIDLPHHNRYRPDCMDLKALAYRVLPKSVYTELRHQKHLRDLATATEPEEQVVRSLIQSGQTVLDIGANFGVFTRLFSELVGPDGLVISFEPVPQTFRTLAAGVERLRLSNVKPINKAVSDHIGSASMMVPQYVDSKGENLYESRIVNAPDSPDSFSVQTVTIDSLQLPAVHFIKIDVEGHELQAIRGGRETIQKFHPTLMVEVSSPQTVALLCDELKYEQPTVVSPSNQIFTYRGK
jgi:FkbM family methyltransferase